MPVTHTSGSVFGVMRAGVLSPPPPLAGSVLPTWLPTRDLYFGGEYRVAGTVSRQGSPSNIPTKARVRLLRDRDGRYIAEQWSDPATGAYSFEAVDGSQTYTVLAYDPTMTYRAVVGDRLTPTPM